MFEGVVGLEPFTMMDYSNKLSAILFYSGCTMRCPYCYNVNIVHNNLPRLDEYEINDFVLSRRGKLDAIIFCGGECTIHGSSFLADVRYVRSLGYEVKIDTNGTKPAIIERLVSENLVDYFAVDYKCSKDNIKKFYPNVGYYDEFLKSLDIIEKSGVKFEYRTTVHPDVSNEEEINKIIAELEQRDYKGTFYIQFFFKCPETLGNVSQEPRYFDVSKLKTDKIKIEYRNKEGNSPNFKTE